MRVGTNRKRSKKQPGWLMFTLLCAGIGRDIAKALSAGGAETYAMSRTQADLDSLKAEVTLTAVIWSLPCPEQKMHSNGIFYFPVWAEDFSALKASHQRCSFWCFILPFGWSGLAFGVMVASPLGHGPHLAALSTYEVYSTNRVVWTLSKRPCFGVFFSACQIRGRPISEKNLVSIQPCSSGKVRARCVVRHFWLEVCTEGCRSFGADRLAC